MTEFSILNSQFSIQRGFTLIELIVVMAMIGIVASIAVATINPIAQFAKGNDAKRKNDLAQMQKALESYYGDSQQYPASPLPTGAWVVNGFTYMQKVPQDPKSPARSYQYKTDTSGKSYWLYASLENTNDSSLCAPNPTPCPNSAGLSCGGVCNYGVGSANVLP